MTRRFTADGVTYVLYAGPAAAVPREGGGAVPAAGPLAGLAVAVAVLRRLYAAAYWRGRGAVVLRAGKQQRREWRWLTADVRTARAAADEIQRIVERGTWRPGSAPPPPVTGATPG